MNAWERSPCPLGCTAGDVPFIGGGDRLHGIPGRFTVVRCAVCGLLRTDPRPTPAAIGRFYPSHYAPYHVQHTPAPPARGLRARLGPLLQPDPRQLPPLPPGRLLEIGCASGAFLDAMVARGWTVSGIEFSPQAAAAAIERGHRSRGRTGR